MFGLTQDSGMLHCSLAFTRYCHYQYCIVYSKHKGGRGAVVQCTIDVQAYCNGVGNKWGGQCTDDGLVHNSFEVNEYLVKAKL